MKLIKLSLLLSFISYLGHAQWLLDNNNPFATSNYVYTNDLMGVGLTNIPGRYALTFYHENNGANSWFGIKNEDGQDIFSIGNNPNQVYLGLRDKFNQELFKMSTIDDFGNGQNGFFAHLPKPNSRLVIGSWGQYLLNEGHKLVIKDGSAKIEGNIISDDKLGIGTNNPISKIHIAGTAPSITVESVRNVGGFAADMYNAIAKKISTEEVIKVGKIGYFGHMGSDGVPIGENEVVKFLYLGAGKNVAYNNNTLRLYPDKTAFFDGKVGIGTTTFESDSKLTVAGDVNIGGTSNATLKVRHIEGKNHDNFQLGDLYLNYTSTGDVIVGQPDPAVPTTRLINWGKVGIGSDNFDEYDETTLLVKGKILAQEIEVIDNVVPDYVFQKYYTGESDLKSDYVMPTLAEVEAFTKTHHHLPEVPSASEIKDHGMPLKKMTTLLLQKIEELTLYTIEQEKLLQEQNAKNEALEQRLKTLEVIVLKTQQ